MTVSWTEIFGVSDGYREMFVLLANRPADLFDSLELRLGPRHVALEEISLSEVFADLCVVRIKRDRSQIRES